MKICSVDNNCVVTLEYMSDPSGYSEFLVETHTDLGHGTFMARNIDVQFLNLEEFLTELDAFILDRSRQPRLEGTYDTYLAFSARGATVFLNFQLGDAFCGRKTSFFHHSGELEIAQDTLLRYAGDFRAFVEAQRSVPVVAPEAARP